MKKQCFAASWCSPREFFCGWDLSGSGVGLRLRARLIGFMRYRIYHERRVIQGRQFRVEVYGSELTVRGIESSQFGV